MVLQPEIAPYEVSQLLKNGEESRKSATESDRVAVLGNNGSMSQAVGIGGEGRVPKYVHR